MRAWPWAAVVALLLVTAASCLDRAPSHRANAQPQAVAPEKPPAAKEEPAASPAKPAAEGEKSAEKTTHEVILEHADRVRYDDKTKEYALVGDVVLRHEDGVLRAQTLRMNSETKKGLATGDLSFADQQSVVTANRLEIDFDARIAVFEGDVRMVTQKKPENPEAKGAAAGTAAPAAEGKGEGTSAQPAPEATSETASKGEAAPPGAEAKKGAGSKEQGEEAEPFKEYWEERTEIRCPELEYFYHEHRAVARNGITARQKDRTGRADEAEYTDDDQRLVLTGNVEMKNEKGETFRAKKITISIADDWLEAEGVVGSRFLVEEEGKKAGEEKGAEGTKAKASGATPSAPAPAPSAPAAETSPPKEKPSQ